MKKNAEFSLAVKRQLEPRCHGFELC